MQHDAIRWQLKAVSLVNMLILVRVLSGTIRDSSESCDLSVLGDLGDLGDSGVFRYRRFLRFAKPYPTRQCVLCVTHHFLRPGIRSIVLFACKQIRLSMEPIQSSKNAKADVVLDEGDRKRFKASLFSCICSCPLTYLSALH